MSLATNPTNAYTVPSVSIATACMGASSKANELSMRAMQERVRACYQHATLKYVSGLRMTNSTLREQLGINPQNAAQASGVIRQAVQAKLVHPADPEHPRAGYVPYWA